MDIGQKSEALRRGHQSRRSQHCSRDQEKQREREREKGRLRERAIHDIFSPWMAREDVLCSRCVPTRRIHRLVTCSSPKHCDNLPRKLHLECLENAGPEAPYTGLDRTRGAVSMRFRAKFQCHIKISNIVLVVRIYLYHDSGGFREFGIGIVQ